MPSLIRINDEQDHEKEKLNIILRRLFQTGNLNFILGSSAFMPDINFGGYVEKKTYKLTLIKAKMKKLLD